MTYKEIAFDISRLDVYIDLVEDDELRSYLKSYKNILEKSSFDFQSIDLHLESKWIANEQDRAAEKLNEIAKAIYKSHYSNKFVETQLSYKEIANYIIFLLDAYEELKKYREIGRIKELKELKEKHINKLRIEEQINKLRAEVKE